MKSILFGAILSVGLLGLSACKSTDNCGQNCGSSCSSACETDGKAAMSVMAVNSNCPYTGNPAKADVTSTHNGKTVAFCCGGCKSKFEKASAADKDAIMSKAK